MATIQRYICDTCGKESKGDNIYDEVGWISTEGTITFSSGRRNESGAISQYISGNHCHHFCCSLCLLIHNDSEPYIGHGKGMDHVTKAQQEVASMGGMAGLVMDVDRNRARRMGLIEVEDPK